MENAPQEMRIVGGQLKDFMIEVKCPHCNTPLQLLLNGDLDTFFPGNIEYRCEHCKMSYWYRNVRLEVKGDSGPEYK